MKKKYIAPKCETIHLKATNQLLAGSYGGKVSSREDNYDEEDYY